MFSLEQDNAIKEKVQKLVIAEFVLEVYYPDWLANVVIRIVHESSQPGFGPNPHSTRLGRVTEKKTRNQLKYGLNPPGRIIGLNGLDLLLGLSCKFYWI